MSMICLARSLFSTQVLVLPWCRAGGEARRKYIDKGGGDKSSHSRRWARHRKSSNVAKRERSGNWLTRILTHILTRNRAVDVWM